MLPEDIQDEIEAMVNTEWDIHRINFESEMRGMEEELKNKSKYHERKAFQAIGLLLFCGILCGIALGIMICKMLKL